MNTVPQNLIFSTEGFANRWDLAAYTREKLAKLARHAHPCIARLRVHVRRETPHSRPSYFAVRATAETVGADYVAHSASLQPATAINAVFGKLERFVTSATRMRKHRQRHGASLEMPLA